MCRLLVDTVTDMLYRFQAMVTDTWDGNFDMLQEVQQVVVYCNECLFDISETYDCVCLQFNERFELRK